MLRCAESLRGCLLLVSPFVVVGFCSACHRMRFGLGRCLVVLFIDLYKEGASNFHFELRCDYLHPHLRVWVIMSWCLIGFCLSSANCFLLSLRRRCVVTVWRGCPSVVLVFSWRRCGACVHSVVIVRFVFSFDFVFRHGRSDGAFFLLLLYWESPAVVFVRVVFFALSVSLIAFDAFVLVLFDLVFVVILCCFVRSFLVVDFVGGIVPYLCVPFFGIWCGWRGLLEIWAVCRSFSAVCSFRFPWGSWFGLLISIQFSPVASSVIFLSSLVVDVGPFCLFCICGIGGALPVAFVVCSFGSIPPSIGQVRRIDFGVSRFLGFIQPRRPDIISTFEGVCVF